MRENNTKSDKSDRFVFSVLVNHPVDGKSRWFSTTTKTLGRAAARLTADAKNGNSSALSAYSNRGQYIVSSSAKSYEAEDVSAKLARVKKSERSANYRAKERAKQKLTYTITAPSGRFILVKTATTLESSVQSKLKYAASGRGPLAALMALNPDWTPSLDDTEACVTVSDEVRAAAFNQPKPKTTKRRPANASTTPTVPPTGRMTTFFEVKFTHPEYGPVAWPSERLGVPV